MNDTPTELTDEERNAADRLAVSDVVEKAHSAVVTTVAADGSLVSRPMGLQHRAADDDLYFFTPDPSDKTNQVRANPSVNVAIHANGNYLSIAGTARVSKDSALIDELWSASAEAWFDDGRDDPAVALLIVRADSAELLATEGPRIVTLAKYVRSLITKDPPDVADTTRVDL